MQNVYIIKKKLDFFTQLQYLDVSVSLSLLETDTRQQDIRSSSKFNFPILSCTIFFRVYLVMTCKLKFLFVLCARWVHAFVVVVCFAKWQQNLKLLDKNLIAIFSCLPKDVQVRAATDSWQLVNSSSEGEGLQMAAIVWAHSKVSEFQVFAECQLKFSSVPLPKTRYVFFLFACRRTFALNCI